MTCSKWGGKKKTCSKSEGKKTDLINKKGKKRLDSKKLQT